MTAQPHLFARYTPPEIVNKLKRELDRFNAAKTRAEAEDHAMNFAWTAWHLYEWTWAGIEALDDECRQRLETTLGASWPDGDSFRDWAKSKCPDLGAYRQISIAAKHAGDMSDVAYDEHPVDVTASATEVAETATLLTIDGIENWDLKIGYNGPQASMGPMFENVLQFWTAVMCYGKNIDWQPPRPRLPKSRA